MIRYGFLRVATYLPRFVGFVFANFKAAKYALLLAVFGVFLEYVALSVMLPLASSKDGHNSIGISGSVITVWVKIASTLGFTDEPRTWLWLFLLLLGARITFGFAQIALNSWVSRSIFAKLSGETFSRVVISEPLTEIYSRSIGYYTAIAGDEAVRVGLVFFHLMQILSALLSAAIGLFLLSVFSFEAFKFTILFLLIAAASIGAMVKKVFFWSNEVALLSRETNTTFIEAFNGIRSIRSMAGETFVARTYRNSNNLYGRVLFILDVANYGLRTIPGLVLIFLGLIVLFPSTGLFKEFSAIYFFTVITMLIRVLSFFGTVVSSGGRLVIDIRAAFDLDEVVGPKSEKPNLNSEVRISHVNTINMINLDCGYVEGKPVLKDISAQFKSGYSYALVGESGSGKSTLSDNLLGLLPPLSGDIEIDNISYRQIDMTSLRQKVILVEQHTQIFSGSIRENISFGLSLTDSEITRAIEIAELKKLINTLPHGFDTRLDYRGANLSGGQRQRIGIARAIVRNPDMLILDEATSALDHETRDRVVRSLIELFSDKILLFITHDISITKSVDKVWRIKHGSLIDAR
jgi:ABC-type bacteriocin/lantibiotic exporter with double-glycine peptidase domain